MMMVSSMFLSVALHIFTHSRNDTPRLIRLLGSTPNDDAGRTTSSGSSVRVHEAIALDTMSMSLSDLACDGDSCDGGRHPITSWFESVLEGDADGDPFVMAS